MSKLQTLGHASSPPLLVSTLAKQNSPGRAMPVGQCPDHLTACLPSPPQPVLREGLQQRPGLLEVGRVKALGEPAVDVA